MAGEEVFAATVGDVEDGSFADTLGMRVGDVVLKVNGVRPRDILEWRRLVDEQDVEIVVDRSGTIVEMIGTRSVGQGFGASVTSALFDRIHTCDNHCEFCFIFQLPKGLRRSLYTKDDDYRLSFLFGNFTTLTRFTEADLERVVDESLSPLHVSIHVTDPHERAQMLRNPRGGVSLRWMRELLSAGVEVKGQIVLCPGVNDGAVLDETLADVAELFPQITAVAVVPLGLSKHNAEARMRVHTPAESAAVISQIESWRKVFARCLGRPVVYAADEFYVAAHRELPGAEYYDAFTMVEDGVGLARSFADEFAHGVSFASPRGDGFFASVDTPVPQNPASYVHLRDAALRGLVNPADDTGLRRAVPVAAPRRGGPPRGDVVPVTVVTGTCAGPLLRDLLEHSPHAQTPVLEVRNDFFGGNTSVAGLLCGTDLIGAIAKAPRDSVYLIPDVCLNQGRFLDGVTLEELREAVAPRTVEVISARGHALRTRLDAAQIPASLTTVPQEGHPPR